MEIEIRPLSPALEDDWLRFFDGEAFADHPDWRECYCRFAPFCGTKAEWEEAGPRNRGDAIECIRSGEAEGYLAYAAGAPVGWVQTGRARSFRALTVILGAAPHPDAGIVTCFVIAKPWRRQGIARRLLGAALDGFRAAGLPFAEAYPGRFSNDEAHQFPGPLDLYLAAGFERVAELERRWVVRKSLG